MLDKFLSDLFSPDTFKSVMPSMDGGGMGGGMMGGSGLGGIFGGADKGIMDRMGGGGGLDPASGGTVGDVMARDQLLDRLTNSNVLSPDGGSAAPVDVPMPRPRPMEAPPLVGGGSPPVAPAAPSGGGDVFSRLAGYFNAGGGAPAPTAPVGSAPAPQQQGQNSLIGRLFGMSPGTDRNVRSSLAGGMSGGDPAFGGGAFMRGMSGSMAGSLNSEKQGRTEEAAAKAAGQTQANFNRQQADREKRTGAYSRLSGVRADKTATGGPTGKAWNKPGNEKWKDAQKLIIDKERALRSNINPLAPKAERDAQTAAIEADLERFKQDTLRQYGLSGGGTETNAPAGAGGPKPTPMSSKEATDKGLYAKGTYDDPAAPESQEEFDALPPGTVFKNPSDGQLYTKKK